MKNNIDRIVIEQFKNYFDLKESEINLNTDIKSFNADSLDFVQIGTNLEQKFDIDFTFEFVREIKKIGDICNYIESELK